MKLVYCNEFKELAQCAFLGRRNGGHAALTFFSQAKRCDLCGDKHFRSSFSFRAALFAGLQFFKQKEKKAKKDKAYSYCRKQEAKAF